MNKTLAQRVVRDHRAQTVSDNRRAFVCLASQCVVYLLSDCCPDDRTAAFAQVLNNVGGYGVKHFS
jgi:hypothetical protein